MADKTITHRWLYNGEVLAEKSFDVKGPRWRVYSSKNLLSDWVGEWKVEVLDEEGNKLFEDGFVYLAKAASASVLEPAIPSEASEKAPSSSASSPSSNHVKRAVFTSDIIDREPIDSVDSLSTDVNKVFFFTEIRDMEGKTITHRWIYDGETKAERPFKIRGPRWRVHSSKNLLSGQVGTWKVEVLDDEGNKLYEDSFIYLTRQ